VATVLPAAGTKNELANVNNISKTFIHNPSLATSDNGVILDQELDENNKGYTVIRIWGSNYEMGYAQAELMGGYIIQAINEIKDLVGNDYNRIREIIAESVWMPEGIEDEFDGMVDCLADAYPSENVDKLDLKVYNTLGDWSYENGCRSHSCWGRYVSDPIKTLSTRRLDFWIPTSSACHHVLCARDPTDGSPQWVNLAVPGYIISGTGVNEYGVLVSLHDYNSHNTDFSAGRMPRVVACRYALTFATNPDVSTHLTDTFTELQNYEMMTGTFLNFYAPEGHGGVMTCNPFESGSDFYHLRTPQESWHHGEAMITTNAWTDGTYTPEDEDFGADEYYDDETPKTLESHWNLLSLEGAEFVVLHMMSIAYRDCDDMTIWADGALSSFERTPRLEWEWDDLFNAEPPDAPTINGPPRGNIGTEYEYTFNAVDPDGHDVKYHIDWDDGNSDVTAFNPSGTDVNVKHIWSKQGTYTIKAKAEDVTGAKSPEGTLTVTMPRNRAVHNSLFLRFLEHFPILRLLLQR
jgi:hypothetical protein